MASMFPTANTLPLTCPKCNAILPPGGRWGLKVPGHSEQGIMCPGSYALSATPTNERL